MGSWFTCYPGRPDYFTHWGAAFKYAAAVLGLPIGSYPHSRPPQARAARRAKTQIETPISALDCRLDLRFGRLRPPCGMALPIGVQYV